MAIFVPPPRLAKALQAQQLRSQATTVQALLEEIRDRVSPEDWNFAERATILVNGRSIHRLRGMATSLGPDDQVWMVFPSAGG